MTLSKTIQTLALASLLTFAPSEMMAAKKVELLPQVIRHSS